MIGRALLTAALVLGFAARTGEPGNDPNDPQQANVCDIRTGLHSCGQAVCLLEQLVADRDRWFSRDDRRSLR